MATETRHIRRIVDAESTIRTSLDDAQIAILTDADEEFVYTNDDASKLYYTANQFHWTGAALVYEPVDFGEITSHDDILIDEYVKLSSATDNYLRLQDNDIKIGADGTEIFTVTDIGIRIGDAGTPIYLLEVFKDQNAGTTVEIKNNTAGTDAYSSMIITANSCSGGMWAFDDSYTANTEYANKLLLYANSTTTALMLAAASTTGEIQFYTGGVAAANKRMVIDSDGNVGVGKAAPSEFVDIQKNQDASTNIAITNTNNNASARAGVLATSNVAVGLFGSYPTTATTAVYRDNTVVVSTTNLVLAGLSSEIHFCANAATIRAKISSSALTLSNGVDLNLEEKINYTGATGVNQITIPDNLADALSFKQSGNTFMSFTTTDSEESVNFNKIIGLGGLPNDGWGFTYAMGVIEMSRGGTQAPSIMSLSDSMNLLVNTYYTTTSPLRMTTGYASRLFQDDENFQFFLSPTSSSADSSVSDFQDRFSISNSAIVVNDADADIDFIVYTDDGTVGFKVDAAAESGAGSVFANLKILSSHPTNYSPVYIDDDTNELYRYQGV